MEEFKERFVVDEHGERVAVLIDPGDYEKLLEELEAVRAYVAAKGSGDEAIAFPTWTCSSAPGDCGCGSYASSFSGSGRTA